MNTAMTLFFIGLFAISGIGFMLFAGYVFRGIKPAEKQTAQMMQQELRLGLAPLVKDNSGQRMVFGYVMVVSAIGCLFMSIILYCTM